MADFVRFKRKSRTDFDNISNKDTNAIYFVNGENDVANQIYLGEDLYGPRILNSSTDVPDNISVYSSSLTKNMTDSKADNCILRVYSDTTLPAIVELDNNTECRYISLTGATSLNIKINNVPASQNEWMFYSSIVLNKINSTDGLSTFVTVDSTSDIQNIIFLNEANTPLTDMETLELLFFSNGMSNQVCCIGYSYKFEEPTP